MASIATVEIKANSFDGDGLAINVPPQRARFTPGAGTNGQRQQVSLTGTAFTALTVPSGAKAIMILFQSAVNLVLKGVTGDTGIPIVPATNALGLPLVLPLGASPSIGILNNGSTATVEVVWL